jgi:addiction module HigA family antidote
MSRQPPIHPGELLAEDIADLGITQGKFAKYIGVPDSRVSAIVLGQRSITADTALRLSKFFGTSATYWMNLQVHYDLELTRDDIDDELDRIKPLPTPRRVPDAIKPLARKIRR